MAHKKENHCTLYPEGMWSSCCKRHDEAYRDQEPKFLSDVKFCLCLLWTAVVCLVSALFVFLTVPFVFMVLSTLGWIWYKRAEHKKDEN